MTSLSDNKMSFHQCGGYRNNKSHFNSNCNRHSARVSSPVAGHQRAGILRRRTRCCFSAVALLLLLSHRVPSTSAAKVEQRITVEPSDVTVIQGSNSAVILPCIVQNKVGELQWTRNGFGLGTDRDLMHFPRYRMIGTDPEGNYSLQISPVELEDDGTYVCLIMAAEGVEPARSKTAKITVLVAPQPPAIVQGAALQTTSGMQLNLECESLAGKPAAQLEWLNGKGEVIFSGVSVTKETPSGGGKLENAKATLSLTPSREYDGQTLTCQASSKALTQPMKATISLAVRYPPEVTLTLNNPKIMEYDSVTFTCTAKANPDDVIYTWYRNNVVIPGNHSTSMTLTRISRAFHGTAISCEVRNAVGKSKASTTLNVLYGPKFTIPPSPHAADRNSDVTLTCHVEGNPTPDIVWTFEKSNRVVASGSKLTITNMAPEKAGRYRCRATVPGFPEIHDYYAVLLKGPPKVRSEREQYGLEGNTLHVECNIRSVPPPNRIRWDHNGKEIDVESSARYDISQEPLEDGVRNILLVHESSDIDFGDYRCTANNTFGEDNMSITMKKQKVVPLMIILAGVIGGIAVIVAITIVIVLWVRRYKKTKDEDDHEPEKQSKTSDRSSNDSDLKVEIRTSSSLSNNDSEPWEEGSIDPRRGSSSHDTYRYSADYAEPAFPPKVEQHNNNGYIPYVDYQRDYNPPPPLNEAATRNSFYGSVSRVDPRYQAAYANPHLRSPSYALPPPQAYANSQQPPIGGVVVGGGGGGGGAASPGSGSATTPAVTNTGTAGSPRSETPPQGQYIVAPQIPLKPGTLATHV